MRWLVHILFPTNGLRMNHRLSLVSVAVLTLSTLVACTTKSAELTAQEQRKAGAADSSRFLTFKNGVRAILQDRNGNYWFGSHNEGAAMFDGQVFYYYTTADGLSDMQIRSIAEDASGSIWFEGARGLSRYTGGAIAPYTQRDLTRTEQWSSAPGDLWFKADEAVGITGLKGAPGVNRFDGTTMYMHDFPSLGSTRAGFSLQGSTPAVKAKDGTIWFGVYDAVIGYKLGRFSVITDEKLGLNDSTGHLHVRSLFEDSSGNLWIGNNGIGAIRYDGHRFENISIAHGLVSPQSTRSGDPSPAGTMEHVFAIGEDADGNLWFGDRDTGAWRFDGTHFTNFTKKDGLTTMHIWSIYRDRQNALLFAMADGAVLRWTGKGFEREW